MWISTAYAQGAGAAGGGDIMMQMLPIVAIVVVFYFLLIRPQQKRAKQHREALASIRRNDRVITNGGLIGTVIRVNEDDDTLTVEIAENTRVQVVRSMVTEVRAKGEPIVANSDGGKGKKDKKDESKSAEAKSDESKDK